MSDEETAKKITILTTDMVKSKPKEFNFETRQFPDVNKRETRKVVAPLTLTNYEERLADTTKTERMSALKKLRKESKRGRKKK